MGEADRSQRKQPKPPKPHPNAVDNSQLIVELCLTYFANPEGVRNEQR
jgi:hypothetical protein